MANNAIQVFDGTKSTVLVGATTTIADGIFSVSGTNATQTEFDNSVDLWPAAVMALTLPDTFASAPAAGTTIDLFWAENNVESTQDEVVPTTTAQQGAHFTGAFRLHNADIDQPMQIIISMLGRRKGYFHIQNNSGVVMSFSSGFKLTCEGCTLTPSA